MDQQKNNNNNIYANHYFYFSMVQGMVNEREISTLSR